MRLNVLYIVKKLVTNPGEGLLFGGSSKIKLTMGLALIIGPCLLAYVPAMHAGFVWDDDAYVTENPLLNAPDGLRRIWFSQDQPSQYFPLVYTTFRIEYALWQLEPFGYHVTNIALHVGNALLLWWLLSRLGIAGSWLAAAVFALHPVHVESVAWITERKNVLMTLFFFLSLLAWVGFTERSHKSKPAWPLYVLSIVLYALALFSKTTACTMPVVLVMLLWLKHIPLGKKQWLQIAPYFLLGLAMAVVAMCWEYHRGYGAIALTLNWLERILLASRALWFYIGKLLCPLNLTFSYPKWNISATDPLHYFWLLAILFAAWFIYYSRKKIGRAPIVALVFFFATLLPMLGFLSLYTFFYTYVADHYQYLASVGLIALAAAITWSTITRLTGPKRPLAVMLLPLVLMTLGTLTWNQCHAYRDSETLWRDTLLKNPDAAIAHHNLAVILESQDKPNEAINHYRKSLEIEPNDEETHYNLALLLKSQGRFEQAINHFREALRLWPNFPQAHNSLGVALKAQGRLQEALSHFHMALKLDPHDAKTHYNLGNALTLQGKLDEAITHYRLALQAKPDFIEASHNLGIALTEQSRPDEEIKHYRQLVQREPDNAQAHYNLGNILRAKGELEDAISHYRKALQLEPDWLRPLNDIARLLAAHPDRTRRDPAGAVAFAERAAKLAKYQDPIILDTLATAYASDDQFDQAVETAQLALELALAANNDKLAKHIRIQLQLFRQATRDHEPTQGRDAVRP